MEFIRKNKKSILEILFLVLLPQHQLVEKVEYFYDEIGLVQAEDPHRN